MKSSVKRLNKLLNEGVEISMTAPDWVVEIAKPFYEKELLKLIGDLNHDFEIEYWNGKVNILFSVPQFEGPDEALKKAAEQLIEKLDKEALDDEEKFSISGVSPTHFELEDKN